MATLQAPDGVRSESDTLAERAGNGGPTMVPSDFSAPTSDRSKNFSVPSDFSANSSRRNPGSVTIAGSVVIPGSAVIVDEAPSSATIPSGHSLTATSAALRVLSPTRATVRTPFRDFTCEVKGADGQVQQFGVSPPQRAALLEAKRAVSPQKKNDGGSVKLRRGGSPLSSLARSSTSRRCRPDSGVISKPGSSTRSKSAGRTSGHQPAATGLRECQLGASNIASVPMSLNSTPAGSASVSTTPRRSSKSPTPAMGQHRANSALSPGKRAATGSAVFASGLRSTKSTAAGSASLTSPRSAAVVTPRRPSKSPIRAAAQQQTSIDLQPAGTARRPKSPTRVAVPQVKDAKSMSGSSATMPSSTIDAGPTPACAALAGPPQRASRSQSPPETTCGDIRGSLGAGDVDASAATPAGAGAAKPRHIVTFGSISAASSVALRRPSTPVRGPPAAGGAQTASGSLTPRTAAPAISPGLATTQRESSPLRAPCVTLASTVQRQGSGAGTTPKPVLEGIVRVSPLLAVTRQDSGPKVAGFGTARGLSSIGVPAPSDVLSTSASCMTRITQPLNSSLHSPQRARSAVELQDEGISMVSSIVQPCFEIRDPPRANASLSTPRPGTVVDAKPAVPQLVPAIAISTSVRPASRVMRSPRSAGSVASVLPLQAEAKTSVTAVRCGQEASIRVAQPARSRLPIAAGPAATVQKKCMLAL